jgi:hypothetical protein
MKKFLLLSLVFIAFKTKAQHFIDVHNYIKQNGLWATQYLTTPDDTLGNAAVGSIAHKGATLYIKNVTKWDQITGSGGSGGIGAVYAGLYLSKVNDSTLKVDSSALAGYFLRRKDSTTSGYYPYSTNPLNYLIQVPDASFTWRVRDSTCDRPSYDLDDGDKFLVCASPTGEFAGQGNKIATYSSGTDDFSFSAPTSGDYLQNNTSGAVDKYNGSSWVYQYQKIKLSQGGDIFGTYASVGTNDNFPLELKTNGVRRWLFLQGGQVRITTAPTTYSTGSYDILVRNQTTKNIEKVASSSFLTTNQNVTVIATGDATGTSSASGTAPSLPLTLATVNSNVGTFTNATVTVNAKGLITAASTGSGGGITSLNSQTGATQTFATPGTSGTDPNWSSGSNIHTLNIPLMAGSSVNSGLLSSSSQVIPGAKEFTNAAIKFTGLSSGSSSHKLVVTDDATGQIYKISPGSYTGFIVDQYASNSAQRAWIDSIRAESRVISNQYVVGSVRDANLTAGILLDSTRSRNGIYIRGDDKQASFNRYLRIYADASDTSLFRIDTKTTNGGIKNLTIGDGGSGVTGTVTLGYGVVTLGRSGGNQIVCITSLNATVGGNWGSTLTFNGATKSITQTGGSPSAAGTAFTWTGSDAGSSTTNSNGGDQTMSSGLGRGTGTSHWIFKTSPGTAASGVLNTAATQMDIGPNSVVISNNLSVSKPITTTGSTPSNAAGIGAGTSPTISVTGNDVAGYVTIATGTSPTAGGDIATITFSAAITNTPKAIIISAGNDNAAIETAKYYVDISSMGTSSFVIKNTASALTASTTYKIFYQVIQ